jgi:hypothetical protein
VGQLLDFKLETYGCSTYVETGTGHGGTLGKAILSNCFSSIY